jgi:F0F1-type ATP synthase assembly protein I
VIVFIIAMLGRFTDYVPSTFQIILYVMYQLGMTLGIFSIMRRREKDPLEDMG